MNAAFGHLLWKEYRAIRAFWLALVVLSLGLQFAGAELFKDPRLIVLNVALATPVFFALGCIGTAFALEKEEGTYDWLRASPATDAQVLLAKLSLCVLATAAMYAVLWPAALWMTGGRLPESAEWHGMLALWPLAAVEGIAWAMLFSLRSERPLPAIALALVVASTVVHLAAMPYATQEFHFDRYLSAVPFRLMTIAPVLAYGIYLGLRWLQGENGRPTKRRVQRVAKSTQRTISTAQDLDTSSALNMRDGSMLLGHLLWQQRRQAWRLMLLLVVLQIAVTFLVKISGMDLYNTWPAAPLIAFAALMGSSVFLPDQERRSYRFFVEHNVPPRYVWLTRLLPWLLVAIGSALVTAVVWIGPHALQSILATWGQSHRHREADQLRALYLSLSAAAIAFAGGQWISMMVRSGLLAGFFTLLLSGVAALWVVACFVMQLSWLYFVIPIPLLFYFATWLRAPDWISEDVTWHARFKAAAAVLVPGLIVLTAAPIARVNQVPKLGPGFSVADYLSGVTPEALAAGELYKRAGRETTSAATVGQLLEAAKSPEVVLANPATLIDWPVVNSESLLSIVEGSALELPTTERLDRLLTIFKINSDLTNYAPLRERYQRVLFETFTRLNEWGTRPDQTDAQLREAIRRLQDVSVDVLHAEDAIKSNYILCIRYIEGDDRLATTLLGRDNRLIFNRALVARLAPWESTRELRALNLKTEYWLKFGLGPLLNNLRAGGSDREIDREPTDIDDLVYFPNYSTPIDLTRDFNNWANDVRGQALNFEIHRRTSLIILALQAHRLKYGALPKSLVELVRKPDDGDGYFDALPVDPFTGRTFVYFPNGLPKPTDPQDVVDLSRSYYHNHHFHYQYGKIRAGEPCLWSAGPQVLTRATNVSPDNPHGFLFGSFMHNAELVPPNYEAWARGEWFPIPLKFPAEDPDVDPVPEQPDDEKPSATVPGPSSDVDDLFRDQDSNESGDVQP